MKRNGKRNFGQNLVLVCLIVLALSVLFPFLWMIISSFKNNTELYTEPWKLPNVWRWSNFTSAWRAGIGKYYMNSVLVTTVSTLIAVLFSAMAAYPLSRSKFRMKKISFIFIISGLMLAPQVVLISLYKMLQFIGLYNTYWGMIVPYVAFRIPFTTFLIWSYMINIPCEIEESATIDGCSYVGIFFRMILPLSKPIIFTAILLAARSIWNEFMFALVFTESSKISTIPIGLMALRGDVGANYPILIAGLVLTSLPLIILFLVLQKQFTRGLSSGSIKG